MPLIDQWTDNRENAKKSTGPRTAEGKERSRRNALRHGLSGDGIVLTDEFTLQVQERKEAQYREYLPDGPAQRWYYERICIESVRLDTVVHRIAAVVDEAAERAIESWDEDRAVEAADLARPLADEPDRVQPRLLQSKQGAEHLLGLWRELDRRAGLGEDPLSLLDSAMDLIGIPKGGRAGAAPALLGDDPRAGWRSLVDDATAELRRRLDDYLIERDLRARARAEHGIDEESPVLLRLRRYEADLTRRLNGWKAELLRLQRGDRPRREGRYAWNGNDEQVRPRPADPPPPNPLEEPPPPPPAAFSAAPTLPKAPATAKKTAPSPSTPNPKADPSDWPAEDGTYRRSPMLECRLKQIGPVDDELRVLGEARKRAQDDRHRKRPDRP